MMKVKFISREFCLFVLSFSFLFSCSKKPELDVSNYSISGSDERCPVGFVEVDEGHGKLSSDYKDHTTCTGFVTGSGDILTARHCINRQSDQKIADVEELVVYFKKNKTKSEQQEFRIRRVLSARGDQELDYVFLEPEDKEGLIKNYSAFFVENQVPDEITRSDKDIPATAYQFDADARLHVRDIVLKNGKVYRGVVASSPYTGGDALVALILGTFQSLEYLFFADQQTLSDPKREITISQNYGAPVIYKGRAVGMIVYGDQRNPLADDESGKIQWFPGAFELP